MPERFLGAAFGRLAQHIIRRLHRLEPRTGAGITGVRVRVMHLGQAAVRGLDRRLVRLLVQFEHAQRIALGAAGVATLLAAPAHVDAATLAAGATGKATPAVAALATTGVAVPMTVVAAAAAAVALVAAATVAVRPATPPKVAATAPASAPATPATRPSVEVSQESGKAAATAFLDALRAGDRAKLAAFWADGDATARDSSATATIEQIRNGPYAAFPQRLTLGGNGYFEMEPTIFNADGTTQPTSPGGPHPTGATLNAQTPTEADIGRLVLHLTVVNSQWRIANAQFVADGAVDSGRRVDLASATTLPISRELGVRAAAAWERANHAMDGSHIDDLKPENVAGFRAALVTYGEAATEFIDAVKGSPLAVRDRDASRLASLVRDLLTVIDHESIEALRRQVASVEKDATLGEAIGRIAAAAEAVSWALDAADELHPATTRPAVAGAAVPVRIAWLNDEVVRIRGPVGFPDWLKSTRAWKQWEIQHDVKTFRTRDDGGSVYAVSISGAESLPDGATRPMLNAIRRYRPDGTLAAIAEFGFGDSPQSWGEFDETGRRYTFRANVGYLDDGKTPFLRDIRFFASDGSIRDWNIWASSPGVVASESIADAIDENQEWVHLPNRAGRETIRSVVELPIDGLPLERVAP